VLVFLDESFRPHLRSGHEFGVLAGIAIPEDQFHRVQRDVFQVRRPYHDLVLKPEDEIKGRELLGKATFKSLERKGFSYQWNLAQELLQYAHKQSFKVFGVVCFRQQMKSFVCGDEFGLDATFRDLFERIDLYMKQTFPQRFAKLIFDDRDHRTNEANARAITNFFTLSNVGLGYDSILKVPLFASSQGHNYGLQLADLVTTVIAMRFQGEQRINPLWQTVHRMLVTQVVGSKKYSSLRVMRDHPAGAKKKDPAAFQPMTGANPPSTEPS
jgi:hypothetical protein